MEAWEDSTIIAELVNGIDKTQGVYFVEPPKKAWALPWHSFVLAKVLSERVEQGASFSVRPHLHRCFPGVAGKQKGGIIPKS